MFNDMLIYPMRDIRENWVRARKYELYFRDIYDGNPFIFCPASLNLYI